VAGYGVNIDDGGFADANSNVTISGALGDVKIGALGAYTWDSLAATSMLDTVSGTGTLARARRY
jgi:hypothetical protein